MGSLLSTVLPLGLAAAVSPVMLSEQIVVLGRGRKGAVAYLAGVAGVLVALIAVVLLAGRSLQLPSAPHLSGRVDLILGVAMIGLALVVRRLPHHAKSASARPNTSTAGEFGFGGFSMGTDFTTLALVVAAAKDIATKGVGFAGSAVAVLLVLLLAALPAWLPLAFDLAAPRTGQRVLGRIAAQFTQHGRLIATLIMLAVGVLLLVRGLHSLGVF